MDIARSVDDHDIHSVLDYRRLREAIVEECTQAHVNLIETLVEQVAARLLADFQEVRSLRLRISKPMAFSDCAAVGVETRSRVEHEFHRHPEPLAARRNGPARGVPSPRQGPPGRQQALKRWRARPPAPSPTTT